MTWRISTELLAEIVAAAAASPEAEICGLLLGRGTTVAKAKRCRNVALDPATRFEIDPTALFAAHRQARAGGLVVLGHYHSHPAGRAVPSPRDVADAAADGRLWIVATAKEATGWIACEGGAWLGRFDPVRWMP